MYGQVTEWTLKEFDSAMCLDNQACICTLCRVPADRALPRALTIVLLFFVCRRFVQSNGLDIRVGLLGLVKDLSSAENMARLLQSGVSRVSQLDMKLAPSSGLSSVEGYTVAPEVWYDLLSRVIRC